jgi:hypothetical protein
VPGASASRAGDLDAGDLLAALFAESFCGLLVAGAVGGGRAAWVAASISAQRRNLGPFLASEPRWSSSPDW